MKLSVNQLHMMQHAIGYAPHEVRNGIYKAFRNYYLTGDDPEWNELVELGLATKWPCPLCKTDIVYHLTKKGLEILSDILGINITSIK